MKNRAVYMTGINTLEIREIPMPAAKDGEVLVRLEYVGICGSDARYLEHGRIGANIVQGDFILGHECAGVVVEAGKGVTTLKPGDRVALEPGLPCGHCKFCLSGKYNLCPELVFFATPPYHGAFMDYIAYPASMAFKLPEGMTSRQGALVEPLCVGIHAARQGQVTLGDSAAILGSGCIGLCTLMAAKSLGATDVTVADMLDKRLNYALKLGATRVCNAGRTELREFIDTHTAGEGCDVVFETAGSVKTIETTPYIVRRGGRIVLVGSPPQDIFPYDFAQLMGKEAQIQTVYRYRNIFPVAIQAIASGAIPIEEIVTHEYALDDIQQAFDFVREHKGEVVKAVVKLI